MTRPTNALDEILPAISSAVADWRNTNTDTMIKKTVKDQLDKHSKIVVLKLLGFDSSYPNDTYTLDHCNGRAGDSTAGDFIRVTQADAIKEWLSTVAMPEMDPIFENALKQEVQNTYKVALLKQVRNLAENQAGIDAKRLIDSISKSNDIDNYVKTLQLIAGQ